MHALFIEGSNGERMEAAEINSALAQRKSFMLLLKSWAARG